MVSQSGPLLPPASLVLPQFWTKLNPGAETLWDVNASGLATTDWDEGVVLNDTHWDTTTQPWTRLL